MEKAGVSALVATVLIILLAILGVTILFSFVIPTVNDNLNEVAKEKVELTIETEGGYTVWDSVNKIAKIQVKRGNDNSVLDGIDFKFFAGANSYNSNSTDVPDPNQVKTYAFTLGDFGKPELVRISAIVNGKIQKATVEIGETSLNGDFDEGTVTGNTTDLTPCESYTTYSGAYELCNCSDLQNMSADLDASYILGQDIDCAGFDADGDGKGFDPIGPPSSGTSFGGVFDGAGYSISSLYINRPTTTASLFGRAIGANISNVNLVSLNLTGNDNVGGLVGYLKNSILDNIYTGGELVGDRNLGGLVGHSAVNSEIYDSSSSMTILGDQTLGGLIGYVSSAPSSETTVNNSFFFGSLFGNSTVGGLVGYGNNVEINYSYSTGSVNGTLYVGGLVGYNYYSNVDNSYSTGSVNGTSLPGGLIGFNYYSEIDNSYWYNSSANPSVGCGDEVGYEECSNIGVCVQSDCSDRF